jgi:hypothetical protein
MAEKVCPYQEVEIGKGRVKGVWGPNHRLQFATGGRWSRSISRTGGECFTEHQVSGPSRATKRAWSQHGRDNRVGQIVLLMRPGPFQRLRSPLVGGVELAPNSRRSRGAHATGLQCQRRLLLCMIFRRADLSGPTGENSVSRNVAIASSGNLGFCLRVGLL